MDLDEAYNHCMTCYGLAQKGKKPGNKELSKHRIAAMDALSGTTLDRAVQACLDCERTKGEHEIADCVTEFKHAYEL